jgi:hypothetical protein
MRDVDGFGVYRDHRGVAPCCILLQTSAFKASRTFPVRTKTQASKGTLSDKVPSMEHRCTLRTNVRSGCITAFARAGQAIAGALQATTYTATPDHAAASV